MKSSVEEKNWTDQVLVHQHHTYAASRSMVKAVEGLTKIEIQCVHLVTTLHSCLYRTNQFHKQSSTQSESMSVANDSLNNCGLATHSAILFQKLVGMPSGPDLPVSRCERTCRTSASVKGLHKESGCSIWAAVKVKASSECAVSGVNIELKC